MTKLTLVAVVRAIILQAEEIENLSMFQQPAAAKALIKDEIVPFLLTMAEKMDGLTTEDELKRLVESQNKKITTLERQVKQMLKPAKAE